MPQQENENFQLLVALFLAEFIRSRRTTLKRAAEISSVVVESLPSLKTEEQVLAFLAKMERDFEEMDVLKHALYFRYCDTDINVYEKEIKEYSASLFETDMVASSAFLQDSVSPGMTIQKLCIKYPEFCRRLLLTSEKVPLLKKLDLAY